MRRGRTSRLAPVHLFFVLPSPYISLMTHFLTVLSIVCCTGVFAQQHEIEVLVTKSEYRLSVLRGDSLVARYPVAVGRNPGDKKRRGDYRTPVGEFRISQIQKSSSWVQDFEDGKGPIPGAYGPWFLRLETGRWTGIGIHGTHDPAGIGTMVTEGCIRLRNGDLEELKRTVTIGTRVKIMP